MKFPPQPSGVDWPTTDWPAGPVVGEAADTVDAVSRELFGASSGDGEPIPGRGVSLALVVVHRGRLVHESYGVQPDTPFGPGGPVDVDTTLVSWSMAKSITNALVGMLVAEGRLDLDAPAPVAEWRNDARSAITLRDLLLMRDGLDFVEEYVTGDDAPVPHVIDMLFGEGATDVASYAAKRPKKFAPGETWNYSSGTTNIVSRIVGDVVGRGDDLATFMRDRLFEPLGMHSASPRFDAAGTFIGSSYVYATARDFARFGSLYLRGGEWNGRRLLPSTWIEFSARQHATDPENGNGYGAHWWIWKSMSGLPTALGYEGQRTIVDTTRDLVVVHLGKWPAETQPVLDVHLTRLLTAFPLVDAS